MAWYEALLLGLVEGITEFLPVSSTGHLALASEWLGLSSDTARRSAIATYIILMQTFALLAIAGLYFPRLKQMARGLAGRDPAGLRLLIHLVIGSLPIVVLGPLLYGTIMKLLFRPLPVLAALFAGGVWMIWLDRRRGQAPEPAGGEIETMNWRVALGIGLFQACSIWPGTSRAMMTIAGGTMLGMKPARATEFSFLLALPALLGASVYELAAGGGTDGIPITERLTILGPGPLLLGIAATVLSAAVAVSWLVRFLERHGLALFGWYRIVLAIALAALLASGTLTL